MKPTDLHIGWPKIWISLVKRSNPGVDVSALEREIDVLVYRLYALTADEITIVKGK